jgi:hypothetical protein
MDHNDQPSVEPPMGIYGTKRRWDALEIPGVQDQLEFEIARLDAVLEQEVIELSEPAVIGDDTAERHPIQNSHWVYASRVLPIDQRKKAINIWGLLLGGNLFVLPTTHHSPSHFTPKELEKGRTFQIFVQWWQHVCKYEMGPQHR